MNFENLNFFKHILFVSALVTAILIYATIPFRKNSDNFTSLILSTEISEIEGTVASNPIFSSAFNGSYRILFNLESVKSDSGLKSQAFGKITVFVPKSIVESVLPERLYTAAGNSKGILFEEGAHLKLSVKKKSNSFLVDSASYLDTKWKSGIFGSIYKFRAYCRLLFRQVMKSWGKAGGLFLALLSGAKEYTESSLSNSFRNAGLSHVLALSGMHLSLFGFISLSLGSILSGKRVSAFLYLLSILLFVWFAGLSPSLFRALLCALFTMAVTFLRLPKPDELTVLSAAFLIHTVIFPNHVTELAFQLSYLSLFGILVFSKIFLPYLSRILPPFLSSSLSASIGAQVFTAPISIFVFGRITPVGIISTIVISPLVTIFIYVGLLGLILCSFAPFLSQPFNAIMNLVYDALFGIASFFAEFPAINFL